MRRQTNGIEAQLGVALFRHNRRGVMLTEAGRAYAHQVAQRLTAIERDTLDLMAGQGAGGAIELAVAPTFATRWLLPRRAECACLRPDITVNLTTRTRPLLFDDEGLDAAIYNGSGQQAGAETSFLLREDLEAVAGPQRSGRAAQRHMAIDQTGHRVRDPSAAIDDPALEQPGQEGQRFHRQQFRIQSGAQQTLRSGALVRALQQFLEMAVRFEYQLQGIDQFARIFAAKQEDLERLARHLVVLEEIEHRFQRTGNRVQRVALPVIGEGFADALREGFVALVAHSEEQRRLVLEMPIHGTACHARRKRDLLQAAATHTALVEYAPRRGDDFLARFLGFRLGTSNHSGSTLSTPDTYKPVCI